MKKQNFSFERSRSIVKFLLIFAGALCILALLMGEGPMQTYASVTAIVCILMSLFVMFVGLRCPYCGKVIFKKCLVVKNCPHCNRNLVTGLKGKKKK